MRDMSGSKFPTLKGEIADPRKMCDCLAFGGDGKIVLVELKKTIRHAGDILEKFRNSVAASRNIVSEADLASCAVLLAKKHNRPTEYNTKHELIEGEYPIKIGHCVDLVGQFTDRDRRDRRQAPIVRSVGSTLHDLGRFGQRSCIIAQLGLRSRTVRLKDGDRRTAAPGHA